jgi:multiple sugar transport system substrate-binding protein
MPFSKFAEQGVEGAPANWDDVITAAKAMTEAGGGRYFGYVFRGGEGNPVVADLEPRPRTSLNQFPSG